MDPEKQFHFRNGVSVGSLDELKRRLEVISYGEFYHHVDHSKNDFANWIRYVLKDPELADELEKVQSIVETIEILDDYLHPRAKPPAKGALDIQSRIEQSLKINVPKAPQAEPEEELPELLTSHESYDNNQGVDENSKTNTDFSEDIFIDESSSDDGVMYVQETTTSSSTQRRHDGDLKNNIESDFMLDSTPKLAANTATKPEVSAHYKRSKEELNELNVFHDQLNRVIVKDFIWGMLFGLLVGFILGKMLLL